MYDQLRRYIDALAPELEVLPSERRALLQPLIDFVRARRERSEGVTLNFICTHNSRRSHLAQIWAATAASACGIDSVRTYSGGTEATVFHPNAVAAIRRAGFRLNDPVGDNPHYRVAYAPGEPALECFSKTFDDPFNPNRDFAAVMTCADADRNCPVVFGAERRISLPYEDPKLADGTSQETARYDARCRQIATEMLYVMGRV